MHSPFDGVPLAAISARFSALEKMSVPVGLYAWGEHLFVLMRRPMGGGNATRWSISKFEPQEGRLIGEVVLPTHAKHLTLIPGPQFWAILEKEVVHSAGKQEIPSMVLMPVEWFEGEGSKPLGGEEKRSTLSLSSLTITKLQELALGHSIQK